MFQRIIEMEKLKFQFMIDYWYIYVGILLLFIIWEWISPSMRK